jgi:ribose-phosphate pyrophosphokinase
MDIASRQPVLFALGGSRAFGAKVAARLGWDLAPHEEREFEDGEHKSRPLPNVEGADAFVLHSLHADAERTGDAKLLRLLFFVGALKESGAARVTALVPYLAYARKDRRTKPRDPVTTRYVAALFEAVGTDCVVTMDVHNPAAFENAFRRRTVNLDLHAPLVRHLAPRLAGREVAVVSPDAGGLKRAERIRQALEAALEAPVGRAFLEKYRSRDVVSGESFVGDVAGRSALIVDDLIASGTTISRAANACRRGGAAAVYAAATHGLFTGDAEQTLGGCGLAGLMVGDAVPPWRLAEEGAVRRMLVRLPVAELFAGAVHRLHYGGDVSELDDTAPVGPEAER